MNNLKSAVLVATGTWLIIAALQFAGLSDTSTTSTKGENAAIGAVLGASVGFGTYLVVGGIGLVTGGVGFAIGEVALTAMGTGAATGSTTVVIFSYPTWLWSLLLLLGCTSFYLAYGRLRDYVATGRVRGMGAC
jgi:hypothetical protein